MEEKNNLKNIIIGVLIVIIILLIAYIVYDKVIEKDVPNNEVTENTPNNENSNNEDDNNSEKNPSNENITKEKIEEFLALMVGDSEKSYNNIEEVAAYGHSEYGDFIRIIRMLLSLNKYELENNNYVFSDTDVKEYAKKYFNLDNFVYNTSDDNAFTYENGKYKSTLALGLYEEGEVIHKKPVVNNIDINDNEVTVTCNIETQRFSTTENNTYTIILEVKDNDYIINKISK